MKALLALFFFAFGSLAVAQTEAKLPPQGTDFLPEIAKARRVSATEGVVLKGTEKISTPVSFRPPVEITVVAKTDSTNLRLGYAADQVIFNWESAKDELRIDGGPVKHAAKPAAGMIPEKKFVTFRWVVTAGKQSIFVDDNLRFEHKGDYSKINNPVSVFSKDSKVTVKSTKVRPIAAE